MGSTAKKQSASQYEIQLGKNAETTYKNYIEKYQPLESGLVEESKRDFTKVLSGRANADAAQAYSKNQGAPLGSGSSGGFGSGNSIMNFNNAQVARGNTVGKAVGNAAVAAADSKDKAQLGALKVGSGGQVLSSEGLRNAANIANRDLIAKAQADSSIKDVNFAFANDLGAGIYTKMNPVDTSKIDELTAQFKYMQDLNKMRGY